MGNEKQPLLRIDRETLVPIGLLVGVVLAAIGATTWINQTIASLIQETREANHEREKSTMLLRSELATLQADVRIIGARVDGSMADRWRGADMRQWAELLQAKNPSIVVPHVEATR